MNFEDYVKKNEKTVTYTVKVACDVFEKVHQKKLKDNLWEIDLVKMGKVFSSPLMANPLDFPNLKNVSVHSFELTLAYPTTTDVIERMVAESLGISRTFVVAYAPEDPRHAQTEDKLRIKDQILHQNKVESYLARDITEDEISEETHELHGDEYIEPFLDSLMAKRKERTVVKYHTDLSEEEAFDVLDNSTVDLRTISSPDQWKKENARSSSPIPGGAARKTASDFIKGAK